MAKLSEGYENLLYYFTLFYKFVPIILFLN
jgi:hypothetical protein